MLIHRLNILGPVGQILFGGLAVFLVYRWLYIELGAESFGLWVASMSYCSLLRLCDCGLGSAVSTELARVNAQDQWTESITILRDYLLSICGLVVLSFCIGLFSIYFFDFSLFSRFDYVVMKQMLMLSLILTFFQVVLTTFASVLDGIGYHSRRSLVLILYNIGLIFGSYYIVPVYGLKGFVLLNVALMVFWSAIYALCIHKYFSDRRPASISWSIMSSKVKVVSRVKKNINFFGINVTATIFDPLVKHILLVGGGGGLVALYEVTGKIPTFCRTLVGEGSRFLIYRTAQRANDISDFKSNLYVSDLNLWFSNLVISSSYLFAIATINIPMALELWVGIYQPQQLAVAISLSFMWYINSLASISFFKDLGGGDQTSARNFQIATVCFSICGALIFEYIWGGYWTIIGIVFALALCSLVFTVSNERASIKYFFEMMFAVKGHYFFSVLSVIFSFVYSFCVVVFFDVGYLWFVAPSISFVFGVAFLRFISLSLKV